MSTLIALRAARVTCSWSARIAGSRTIGGSGARSRAARIGGPPHDDRDRRPGSRARRRRASTLFLEQLPQRLRARCVAGRAARRGRTCRWRRRGPRSDSGAAEDAEHRVPPRHRAGDRSGSRTPRRGRASGRRARAAAPPGCGRRPRRRARGHRRPNRDHQAAAAVHRAPSYSRSGPRGGCDRRSTEIHTASPTQTAAPRAWRRAKAGNGQPLAALESPRRSFARSSVSPQDARESADRRIRGDPRAGELRRPDPVGTYARPRTATSTWAEASSGRRATARRGRALEPGQLTRTELAASPSSLTR